MMINPTTKVQWVVRDDCEMLNDLATQVLIDVLMNTSRPVIGFATGDTPRKLYTRLIARSLQDESLQRRWQDVIGFNLDEYVGLHPNHPQSYHHYMWKHVYEHLPITKEHIYIPNGIGHLKDNCKEYDDALQFYGGPDIQILGIGKNGHIGFNEPGDHLEIGTHVTRLSETTRQANARFFTDEAVPLQAVTMGIGGILHAKRILLLAFGSVKRAALLQAFSGSIDTKCPASFLQLHDRITVFTDQSIDTLDNGSALLSMIKNPRKL